VKVTDGEKTLPEGMTQEEYDRLCAWYVARLRTFNDPAFTPAALVNIDHEKLQELVSDQFAIAELEAISQPAEPKESWLKRTFKRFLEKG
jgi:hypothetical protein